MTTAELRDAPISNYC